MLEFQRLTKKNWKEWKNSILSSENAFSDPLKTTEEEYEEIIGLDDSIAIIATINGEYVGNAIGTRMAIDEIEDNMEEKYKDSVMLDNIVVEVHHKGKGYGKLILAEFLRRAKEKGYKKLYGYFQKDQSLYLIKKAGAIELQIEQNWHGSGEEYTLCVLDPL